MDHLKFIEVNEINAAKEGFFCVKNPKYEGFQLKLDWLRERWNEGLKLKILKNGEDKIGFIEYIPCEYAWRPVQANNYLFIHCLMVYGKKNYHSGYGSLLIKECIDDAKKMNKAGVAVMASKGTWMADKSIFLKNGFRKIDSKDRFDLLVYKLHEAPNPIFINWEENLKKYNGLNLIYANQCPLFIKSVDEMKQTAKEYDLDLQVSVLKTAGEAQQAPSGYGTYSLVHNGKLLSDHYISNTRFKNILNKEIKKS
jgi:hypothetical protein